MDYSITIALAVILAAKYIFFDSEVDIEKDLAKKEGGSGSPPTMIGNTPITQSETSTSLSQPEPSGESQSFGSYSPVFLNVRHELEYVYFIKLLNIECYNVCQFDCQLFGVTLKEITKMHL